MKMSGNRLRYFKNLFYLMFSAAYHAFFRKRDQGVVLVGAWMGEKFADNSRYLYQYLSSHAEQLNLKHVVWATRNPKLKEELEASGYECCLIGTKESFDWHMKAGVHILCNAVTSYRHFQADIDTRYSYGAKKIQLWHGVGVKSIGVRSNSLRNRPQRRPSYLRRQLAAEGGWGNAYFLCTSPLNMDINQKNENYIRDFMFISMYPRYCQCLQYTQNEKDIIETIKTYPVSILYLPTFRTTDGGYVHPLSDFEFCNWLSENGVLWIEKPHSASSRNEEEAPNAVNRLLLDHSFDINVLYDFITVLATDYSSAAFDAIYHQKPVLLYVPDLETYQTKDVGLLVDYSTFWPSLLCRNTAEIRETVSQAVHERFFTDERNSTYDRIRTEFFQNQQANYEDIWDCIRNLK